MDDLTPFPLGQVVATPGALRTLEIAGQPPEGFLDRHLAGDWGDVCDEDRTSNDAALLANRRLLSAYRLAGGASIWIITEADRSATTLLLPEEY